MTIPPPLRAALFALVLAATPAAAQPDPQVPAPGGSEFLGRMMLLRNLSPEGRATVQQALRAAHDPATRQQIESVRARMLDLLAAEVLDVGALSQAMLEERNLVQGQQQRLQAGKLRAFEALNVADRRALVAAARDVQARVADRRSRARAFLPAERDRAR